MTRTLLTNINLDQFNYFSIIGFYSIYCKYVLLIFLKSLRYPLSCDSSSINSIPSFRNIRSWSLLKKDLLSRLSHILLRCSVPIRYSYQIILSFLLSTNQCRRLCNLSSLTNQHGFITLSSFIGFSTINFTLPTAEPRRIMLSMLKKENISPTKLYPKWAKVEGNLYEQQIIIPKLQVNKVRLNRPRPSS